VVPVNTVAAMENTCHGLVQFAHSKTSLCIWLAQFVVLRRVNNCSKDDSCLDAVCFVLVFT